MNVTNAIERHVPSDSNDWNENQYCLLCIQGTITGILNNKIVTLHPNDLLYKTKITSFTVTSVSNDSLVVQMIPLEGFEQILHIILAESSSLQTYLTPLISISDEEAACILNNAAWLNTIRKRISSATTSVSKSIHTKQYNLFAIYVCLDVFAIMAKKKNRASNSEEFILASFVELIYSHCHEQRTVSFYAQQLNYSVSYFSHKIQQETEHTPGYWIDKITTEQIKTDLIKSMTITSKILSKYHFRDQTQFCRYFKRNTGITPKEFVKSLVLKNKTDKH